MLLKPRPSWSSIYIGHYQKQMVLKFCKTVVQFQNVVKYHESMLLAMTPQTINLATQFLNKNFQTQQFHPQKAHINMVGWTPSLEPPRFPRDDKNVSPRKTPESVNTRPCWHCRSRKHWDYECQHSRKGERQV